MLDYSPCLYNISCWYNHAYIEHLIWIHHYCNKPVSTRPIVDGFCQKEAIFAIHVA